MIDLLSALSKIPSPSGEEANLSAYLSDIFKHLDTKSDAHGTLIVHKKGEGTPILLATAMDTPCLFVTSHDNNFSRFMTTDDFSIPEGTLVETTSGQKAVVAKDDVGQYLDSGGNILEIGQRLIPALSMHSLSENRYAGFALGQYAAMTALASVALADTKRDAYFVFGTKTYIRQFSPAFMRNINVETMISLEVSLANDTPAEKNVFLALGDGTALRVKDASMLSVPSLIEALENNTFSTKREVSNRRGIGGTLQKAFGGVKSVGIGIPTRYAGTLKEIIDIRDIQNTMNLLSHLLR